MKKPSLDFFTHNSFTERIRKKIVLSTNPRNIGIKNTSIRHSKNVTLIMVFLWVWGMNFQSSNGALAKKENISLDFKSGFRAGCVESPTRHHPTTDILNPPLGLGPLPLRGHTVVVVSCRSGHRPFFVSGPTTGGRGLVTSTKVTDMKNVWSCADGAHRASAWRPGRKGHSRIWITLTAEDCRLLEKVRRPGQTHVEAFRELLDGYGKGGVA